MTRGCFVFLTFVVLADAPALAQFRGAPGGDLEAAKYGWLPTLKAGKAEARRSGQPLMVVLRCLP